MRNPVARRGVGDQRGDPGVAKRGEPWLWQEVVFKQLRLRSHSAGLKSLSICRALRGIPEVCAVLLSHESCL